ncbi:MAG: DUF523 and DUF1722 domain-containing protein [Kiritimatiellia bacterium]
MSPIKVGISSCLLGEPVRYNGGHRRDPFLSEVLGRFFTYVPVCPEVECGLSVPRESMRLRGSAEAPRLVTLKTGVDCTEQMKAWAVRRLEQLRSEGLCAFIFKYDSPSCGQFRVKLYGEKECQGRHTAGIWARAFTEAFAGLPVEEDGRLHNPAIRENFIERVFALKRFRDEAGQAPSAAALVRFQTRNKLLIMAHSPAAVAELGRLVAGAKVDPVETARIYEIRLLAALAETATVPRQVNVLQHMQGYFKEHLTAAERKEMEGIIRDYQKELVPLIAPITLFKHFISRYGIRYLARQTYLNPHPPELKLRNHA